MRTLSCPRCGAPLPPRAYRVVIVCSYCNASVTHDGETVRAADYRQALARATRDDGGRPRLEIGGFAYRVLGLVAQGESSDVFLATRARTVSERVLVKVLRSDKDRDLLDAEWSVLTRLGNDAVNSEALRGRLPQLVGRGPVKVDGQPAGEGLVLRALSGFADTFDDVLAAYPAGVDGTHAAWMWRRTLELLAGVHRAGFAHGAVLPQHLVVHARDHGVMLVGWSCATPLGHRESLRAASTVARDCYPASLLAGAPPSSATDIIMSARCVARLLGGSAEKVPAAVAAPMAALVEACAAGKGGDDAWALRSRVGEAAREAYGPARYYKLSMPGFRA
jgi:hypothetical protein